MTERSVPALLIRSSSLVSWCTRAPQTSLRQPIDIEIHGRLLCASTHAAREGQLVELGEVLAADVERHRSRSAGARDIVDESTRRRGAVAGAVTTDPNPARAARDSAEEHAA